MRSKRNRWGRPAMMASMMVLVMSLVSVSVAQEQDKAQLPRATAAVASVDGEEIDAEAFNEKMEILAKALDHPVSAPVAKMFTEQALDTLVERHLIDAELRDIEIDEEELEGEKSGVEGKSGELSQTGKMEGANKSQTPLSVVEKWQSADEHQRLARLDVYLQREYGLEVPQEEVRQFFDENRAFLSSSEKVNLRKIRMGIGEEDRQVVQKRAQEIYEAITGGEMTFFEAEVAISDSQLTDEGGGVGYVRRSGLVEQVADVAFEMDRGQVSEPIETPYAIYIVEVMDRREEQEADFEELAPAIERLLTNDRRQTLYRKLVDELRESAQIEIYEKNIELSAE